MALHRWFRSLFPSRQAGRSTHRQPLRRQLSRRLRLEILEDRTLPSATISVVSTKFATTPSQTANKQSEITPMHGISDDGRYVVFASTSTNLVQSQAASASGTTLNIYLYDSEDQTTTLVSGQNGSSTKTANGDSFNPVVSGDGSIVVFYSAASNLISGVTVPSGAVELYCYSVKSGTLTLISFESGSTTTGANGANPAIPATGSSSGGFINTLGYAVGSAALGTGENIMGLALPSVSDDGKYIAYISDASNLGGSDTGGDSGAGQPFTNVFLYDNNPDDEAYQTNTLVSHTNGDSTTSADGFASTCAISGDGTTVAFTDPADDLTASTSSTLGFNDQLYVWSRTTNSTTGLSAGQTVLASHSASSNTDGADIPSSLQGGLVAQLLGFGGWTADTPPSLSNDGSVVAYYDGGDNLVANQAGTASVLNVFRYDVFNNKNTLVSHVAPASGANSSQIATALVTAGDNPQNQIADPDLGAVEATAPAISSDGRYIAFANNSSNLLSTTSPFTTGGSTYDGRDNVWLYDNDNPNTLTLVSHADGSTTTPDDGGGTAPSMSADGRYIAFVDLAVPATGDLTSLTGSGDVRIFDSQAADPSAQPAVVGDNSTHTAFDDNSKLTDVAASLAPTVMSADTPSNASQPVVGWDGLAASVVSSITDSNSNFDVFIVTDETTPPSFSSSTGSTTVTYGDSVSYTLTASGNPAPSFSVTNGTLPDGLTLGSNGVITGTPTAGGSTKVTITASNSAGSASQDLTIVVNRPPTSFTNDTPPTPTYNTTITPFQFTTQGYPNPTFSYTGNLPDGLNLSSSGKLTGTPTHGGQFTFIVTANNGIGTTAQQQYTLTVNQPANIPSQTLADFLAGGSNSDTIVADGYPAPTFSSSDLPAGLSLSSGGVLTGTPNNGGGPYSFHVTAHNGVGTDSTRLLTLNVNQVPSIPSQSIPTFTVGVSNTYTFTATGFPTPSFSSSDLPAGMNLTSAGKLTGTPTAGGGVYSFHVTASNIAGSDTEPFSITVDQSAGIPSQSIPDFLVGASNSYTFITTGYPAPSITSPNLPAGLQLSTAGKLTGTPTAGAGPYSFKIVAHNGVGADASQTFSLGVDQAASLTAQTLPQFSTNASNSYTFLATGYPNPTFSSTDLSTSAPGLHLSASGVLTGTPTAGAGVYTFHITAANSLGSDTESFSLTVVQPVAPAITTTSLPDLTIGVDYKTVITATGAPTPTLTPVNLPTGMSLASDGTLTGTPATGGVYMFTVTASNGVKPDASKIFTLTALQAPVLTTLTANFQTGVQGSFALAATGYPKPTLHINAQPSWLSLTSGNLLVGTPPADGTYTFDVEAVNSVGDDSETFTLIATTPPKFTSSTTTTFMAGKTSSNSFSFATTTGAGTTFNSPNLPAGLSLSTAGVLTGTPTRGAGTYTFMIDATNTLGQTTAQSFTLKVYPVPALAGPIHYYALNPSEGTATTGQKSIIRHIQLTFNEAVSLDPAGIRLTYLGGGTVSTSASTLVNLKISGSGTTTITLSFTGSLTDHGSLVDGRYQLHIDGTKVHGPGGLPMATDVIESFYRLYGDANGDGVVNGADVAILKAVYGRRSKSPATLAPFNLSGTGATLTARDIAAIINRANANTKLHS